MAGDEGFELGLLPPEESLDPDELGDDFEAAGFSPLERRSGNLSWGLTEREARTSEPLSARLARELPEETDGLDGDGIGDAADTDGEIIDDQVGSRRAGRLIWAGSDDGFDAVGDYTARDVGIDGGAASAEEAAIHVVVEDELL